MFSYRIWKEKCLGPSKHQQDKRPSSLNLSPCMSGMDNTRGLCRRNKGACLSSQMQAGALQPLLSHFSRALLRAAHPSRRHPLAHLCHALCLAFCHPVCLFCTFSITASTVSCNLKLSFLDISPTLLYLLSIQLRFFFLPFVRNFTELILMNETVKDDGKDETQTPQMFKECT